MGASAGIHDKGHFDDEDEELEVDEVEEEPPSQENARGDSARDESTDFLPLSSAPPPETPATDLRPYRFARIAGGGSEAVSPVVTGADGDVPLTSLRYPYMASLQMEGVSPSTSLPFDYHMCGGVLIAPDIVMSAAHCGYYTPSGIGAKEVYEAFNGVEIGRTDLSPSSVPAYDNLDSTTYHLPYENLIPRRLFLHEEYDEETYQHDIMLVRLHGKSRHRPVRLWTPPDDDRDADAPPVVPTPQDDQRLTLIGWGATDAQQQRSQRYSDLLREADVKALDNARCRNIQVEVPDGDGGMLATTLNDHVSDEMMCAYAAGRHVCTGDDGGPAVAKDRSSVENMENPERDVVVGIISWGYGCVDPKYPAVLTRVESHYGWIREVVCRESADPPGEFKCPGRGDGEGMTLNSAVAKETVTLKLKLDRHSIQTGFVIQAADGGKEVVAQRQTGYYVGNVNQIVEERMELPRNRCYTITFLDSFGDGFCCDWGGGKGTVYRGVDTGYYTGDVLVEVDGRFGYEAEGSFCLNGGGGMVEQSSETEEKDKDPPQQSTTNSGGSGSSGAGSSSQGQDQGQQGSSLGSSNNNNNNDSDSDSDSDSGSSSNSGSGSNNNSDSNSSGSESNNSGSNSSGSSNASDSLKSGWNGPVTSPEFTYCTQFCQSNPIALTCGSHACYHGNEPAATSDADQGYDAVSTTTSTVVASSSPTEPVEWVDDEDDEDKTAGYHLTVQFRFDQHPEEVSWVLYDLTINQVTNFVDFDTYTADKFADRELNVVVDVDGPDAGEKKYAFTVYDKSSNGLCCEYGEGYYSVYLGDIEDDLLLLTDDEYEFSSSYYFTLFENATNATNVEKLGEEVTTDPPTDPPTEAPTESPTDPPTNPPTEPPTDPPTASPTLSPTTPKPTFPWETKRSESSSAIGAKWKTEKEIPTGRFNDLGGNQDMYKFHVMGADSNVSGGGRRWGGGSCGTVVVGGMFALFSLGLLFN